VTHSKAQPVVLKLGGSSALAAIPDVAAYAAAGRPLAVVHGGGPQISALMRDRGVEPRFVGGRRVTSADTLGCVIDGLGDVSRALCAGLREAGLDPVPLFGWVFRAERVPELQRVGRPVAASIDAVRAAWQQGRVPVIAPLGTGPIGEMLNVNADDAASCLAVALGARELVFLSDVPGVLDDDGNVIPALAASAPPSGAFGGMLPKLEACAAAVRAGVGEVRIGRDGTVVTA
jgi:acetylglutamate kinase